MSAAYIQVHFRQVFSMEENNINPDQTAPLLGPYCLQEQKQIREQMTSQDWQKVH